MESLVSDIQAGNGKIANLFYSVRSLQAVKGLFHVDIFAEEFNRRSLLYLWSRVFLDFLENQNKLVSLNFNQASFYATGQLVETFLLFFLQKYIIERKKN